MTYCLYVVHEKMYLIMSAIFAVSIPTKVFLGALTQYCPQLFMLYVFLLKSYVNQ